MKRPKCPQRSPAENDHRGRDNHKVDGALEHLSPMSPVSGDHPSSASEDRGFFLRVARLGDRAIARKKRSVASTDGGDTYPPTTGDTGDAARKHQLPLHINPSPVARDYRAQPGTRLATSMIATEPPLPIDFCPRCESADGFRHHDTGDWLCMTCTRVTSLREFDELVDPHTLRPRALPSANTAAEWDPTIADLITWFETSGVHAIPDEPFELEPNRVVRDPAKWRATMLRDIAAGPAGPRSRYGALPHDIKIFRAAVEREENRGVDWRVQRTREGGAESERKKEGQAGMG